MNINKMGKFVVDEKFLEVFYKYEFELGTQIPFIVVDVDSDAFCIYLDDYGFVGTVKSGYEMLTVLPKKSLRKADIDKLSSVMSEYNSIDKHDELKKFKDMLANFELKQKKDKEKAEPLINALKKLNPHNDDDFSKFDGIQLYSESGGIKHFGDIQDKLFDTKPYDVEEDLADLDAIWEKNIELIATSDAENVVVEPLTLQHTMEINLIEKAGQIHTDNLFSDEVESLYKFYCAISPYIKDNSYKVNPYVKGGKKGFKIKFKFITNAEFTYDNFINEVHNKLISQLVLSNLEIKKFESNTRW